MNNKLGPYRVVDLSPARRVWLNTLDLPGPPHRMVGLLEVDVTVARQFIAEHKARTGETLFRHVASVATAQALQNFAPHGRAP
ncbi:MAG: hypothetical protein JSV81_10560 [Anaerolineales bacterium]|nr:MAG: hypothetical protein JSV81_10560 [Anaerolineales bacterium]